MSERDIILEEIRVQGDVVRQLKADKAEKEKVNSIHNSWMFGY